MRLIVICFLLSTVSIFGTVALPRSYNYAGFFPTLDHTGNISKKFSYGVYAFGAFPFINMQYRGNVPAFLLFYTETSLTYKINKNFSFTTAYVYQKESPIYQYFINENRMHFQVQHTGKIKFTEFKQRIRSDNRFLKAWNENSSTYAHRIRYLTGFKFPMSKKSSDLYCSTYTEMFFNTPSKKEFVFAENWTSLAFGFKLNDINSIEVGPLFITWKNQNIWWNQYYLQATWVSKLN